MTQRASASSESCVAEVPRLAPWEACFSIGEVSLRLCGEGPEPEFGRQIEIFRSESESETCDMNLHLQWAEDLLPPPGRLLFDSSAVWTLHEDGTGFLFDFASSVFGSRPYKRLCVDRDFREGRILLNRKYFSEDSSCGPLDYPLDELVVMHRLGRERGVEVHAAGMRDGDGAGYLFLGHSGAGKSTTTRLWNQHHAMTVLSDDRIVLRESTGLNGEHEVWMHGTPWHGEAAFAAPEKARIERLFILEHAPANRITPLRGTQAVAEIMARSFLPFYDAVALENTMRFLEDIVAAIPCYRLEFRPDGSAVEAVRRFRA